MKRPPEQPLNTPDISGLSAAELLSVVADLQQKLVDKEAEIQHHSQAVKHRDNYIQILEELLRWKRTQQFAASSEKQPHQVHLFDEAEMEAEIERLRDQLPDDLEEADAPKASRQRRQRGFVDATIISAPSSTKNSTGKRDPEMHQTRKGNEWHFGMKMHIGVDDTLGLIHSIDTTAANVHDIVPTDKLLHGEEQRVFGDAGYLGIQKRDEHKHRKNVSWFIAKRPGTRKKLDADKLKAEKIKASVRAKVEHPFRYIKQVFGYGKVRYRGLAKNNNRLHLLAAFSNLLIGEKYMLA